MVIPEVLPWCAKVDGPDLSVYGSAWVLESALPNVDKVTGKSAVSTSSQG